MNRQGFQTLLVEFESGKKYYQTHNSLELISTWIESLEELITEEGRRTKLYTSLYLRQPQLNFEEKKLFESIQPLSEEEDEIIVVLKVLDGLATLESVIKAEHKLLVIELIDRVIDFLRG